MRWVWLSSNRSRALFAESGIMGLATWWRIRRMTDPVPGMLRVKVCAQPETAVESAYYSARIIGTVTAPQLTGRLVTFDCTVQAKRCPRSGQSIPVVVDRADPDRIAIRWDRVPVRAERL